MLEVLLASAIAVFLLGGLYVAFDVTLRQTHEARDAVYVSHLTRGALNRLTLDLASTVTPLPTKSGVGTATDVDTSSTEGTTTDSSTITLLPFDAGVIGTNTQLTIFASKVPFGLGDSNTFSLISNGSLDSSTLGSDLVRVTYWMGNGGAGPFCRQERPWITASGIGDTSDPDTSDEAGDAIVDEATSVTFEYFDGTTGEWLTEWDGSIAGADGSTPLGPPRAIRVTLTLQIPPTRPNQPAITRTAVQVIPVRTAPGLYTPPQVEVSSDSSSSSGSGTTGTTGSSTTGSGTTGSGM